MLSITITLIIIAVSLLWGYSRWRYSYWSSKGVSVPSGFPLIGHLFQLMLGERWDFVRNSYKLYSEEKVFGIYEFFNPTLFVCEPSMVRQILIKDFDSFTDRREFAVSEDKNNWFREMLSIVNGEKWKLLRSTMSPTFSSGKMKHMFSIVNDQADNFVIHCDNIMKKSENLDIKKSFGLFTMDVIAATAFGIECNSLLKEDPIFAKKAEDIFASSPWRMMKFVLLASFPKLCSKLGITFMDDTWEFFKQVSKETTAERRKTGLKRGDFLDLLLEEQEKQKENFEQSKDYLITDQTILAESVLFLIAGYDTTANALTMTCYYLAKHPEVQQLLRNELKTLVLDDGKLDYHGLMEAKYLDACVNETLRLVPPLPNLERKCTKEYSLEGTDLKIPVGMHVEVPVWGLHRDPLYWKNPLDYNPERFLPENKANIVPFTYMPFGLGPRNCIAMRFALMEAKLCLAKLVLNYEITMAPGYGKLKLENGGGVIRPAPDTVVINLNKV